MKLITRKICMTKDLGVHGNLFGGNMLAWIDEAAASMAAEVCRTPNLVTIKIDEVIFRQPVKQGFQIGIYGEVGYIGNTSITLQIEARKRNLYNHQEDVVCSTHITFVRIDEYGSPIPISEEVKREWQTGKELVAA